MTALEYAKTHPRYLALSDSDRAMVKYFNSREGKVNDCPVCLGRRWVNITPTLTTACDCQTRHENMRVLAASGLTEDLKRMSFERFNTPHGWQKEIKAAATKYAKDPGNDWFFIGGQVGSGKTHICSAIMTELIGSGRRAKYMVWTDEVDGIKANAEGFSDALDKLMDVEVLYIDDFLKTPKEQRRTANSGVEWVKKPPTAGELNAAFKLINHRYNRGDRLTIFSSEFFIDDIMGYDAGLGSRIYQRCKKFRFEIGNDNNKNMRLAE